MASFMRRWSCASTLCVAVGASVVQPWVRMRFGAGKKPTFSSHAGEEISGQPLQLDQMSITHFSFTVPDHQHPRRAERM